MLGDLLGRGGMAEVFAGRSLGSHGFQKPVAIKRLLPELAKDEIFVTRLIGEAKLLVGMAHGNIVSVLDLTREADDVFLVMEYVDGPSLRQLIKARGTRGISLGIATYIVQSAAAGLEFAHARPGGAIIHADISPSNLLLTSSGEVRVADFGIARREGRMDGLIEGKWAYMAPEQARGEALTPASDVFALGVVLYELITGRHPLGRHVTANERENVPVRVVPPRIVRPNVPPGLDAICLKALAHDARERFATMQDLIDAIVEQRFANGWRDGAKELAESIREAVPVANPSEPRTAATERPLTILTRSLIADPSASSVSVPGESSVSVPGAPRTATGTQPGTVRGKRVPANEPPSMPTARPSVPALMALGSADLLPLASADVLAVHSAELPALVPPEVAARLSSSVLPGPELVSVVGAGRPMPQAEQPLQAPRWTISVLLLAALVGTTAAIAVSLAPSSASKRLESSAAGGSGAAQVASAATLAVPTPTRIPAMVGAPPAPAPAAAVGSDAAEAGSGSGPGSGSESSIQIAPPPPPAAVGSDAAESGSGSGSGSGSDSSIQPAPAHPVPPVPLVVAAPAHAVVAHAPEARRHHISAPVRAGRDGTLRVLTYDGIWADVSVTDEHHENLGSADVRHATFKLAPGAYTVRLHHDGLPGRGCVVKIEPGGTLTLKVDMQEGACDHY